MLQDSAGVNELRRMHLSPDVLFKAAGTAFAGTLENTWRSPHTLLWEDDGWVD